MKVLSNKFVVRDLFGKIGGRNNAYLGKVHVPLATPDVCSNKTFLSESDRVKFGLDLSPFLKNGKARDNFVQSITIV